MPAATAPAQDAKVGGELHLPDLRIEGFRGIDALSVSRLGRVTLIGGKNSVGKTTLLDAVGVYAARGSRDSISEVLRRSEELTASVEKETGEKALTPNYAALFHGREPSQGSLISIGPLDKAKRLNIKVRSQWEGSHIYPDIHETDGDPMLVTEFRGQEFEPPAAFAFRRRRRAQQMELPPPPSPIHCELLRPNTIDNRAIARYLDGVALTDDETRAAQALNIALDGGVERIAMIGEWTDRAGRRAVAKIKGHSRPVPLRSLGDGAMRMFGVALALANSQDGFLLIDEAENGVHHSVQRAYWRMVLQAAQEYNVQVFATTHSWDCVRGFAQALADAETVKGAYFRMDRRGGCLRAVEYSEEDLAIAAEMLIEVR